MRAAISVLITVETELFDVTQSDSTFVVVQAFLPDFRADLESGLEQTALETAAFGTFMIRRRGNH